MIVIDAEAVPAMWHPPRDNTEKGAKEWMDRSRKKPHLCHVVCVGVEVVESGELPVFEMFQGFSPSEENAMARNLLDFLLPYWNAGHAMVAFHGHVYDYNLLAWLGLRHDLPELSRMMTPRSRYSDRHIDPADVFRDKFISFSEACRTFGIDHDTASQGDQVYEKVMAGEHGWVLGHCEVDVKACSHMAVRMARGGMIRPSR